MPYASETPDQVESARAARRRHYERNPEPYKARAKRQRDENRAIIAAAKDVPCADCGDRFPHYVMDFDHRDPAAKIKNVGQLVYGGRKQLLAEIEKCDVVCANCHRERTWQQLVASGKLAEWEASREGRKPTTLS